MKNEHEKIAFSGGCYWCMEAIYQSLKGVKTVEQGFVAPDKSEDFSEAVIVHYDSTKITLKTLMEIHLRTHSSTVNHSMRKKYKSAVYTFSDAQIPEAEMILKQLQSGFKEKIITQVLPFGSFRFSEEMFHNYYYANPEKPFCRTNIDPKLKMLISEFSNVINKEKLQHLY
ncbi:peptide methionine sulfoxide reductase [Echinicola soli]|uniref:peptide-methionine (S)-S-oxide reductase n=1 Tax=Echinicola soli TaxID=2591634 RepID=A0A514CFF1_9BACT|nr:peptide-methionine (S)-S-oxide reductase [Echinicola soli]QDH78549.1 peptide methionine sulfoxide reductase [Echinicola soli]